MQFQKARPEGSAKRLATRVDPRRVLGGKQHEVRVRLHHFLQLGDVKLPVVVQQPALRTITINQSAARTTRAACILLNALLPVERLEHFRRRKVELVEHNPVP